MSSFSPHFRVPAVQTADALKQYSFIIWDDIGFLGGGEMQNGKRSNRKVFHLTIRHLFSNAMTRIVAIITNDVIARHSFSAFYGVRAAFGTKSNNSKNILLMWTERIMMECCIVHVRGEWMNVVNGSNDHDDDKLWIRNSEFVYWRRCTTQWHISSPSCSCCFVIDARTMHVSFHRTLEART